VVTARETPHMKLSAQHLKRYREIIALLWKYGRSDLVERIQTEEEFAPPEGKSNGSISPDQLADDL
jgi:ubiquinone biosynthesis protein